METLTLSLKAPRVPSDYALLDSADPVALSLAFLARRREARVQAVMATEGATQIDDAQ